MNDIAQGWFDAHREETAAALARLERGRCLSSREQKYVPLHELVTRNKLRQHISAPVCPSEFGEDNVKIYSEDPAESEPIHADASALHGVLQGMPEQTRSVSRAVTLGTGSRGSFCWGKTESGDLYCTLEVGRNSYQVQFFDTGFAELYSGPQEEGQSVVGSLPYRPDYNRYAFPAESTQLRASYDSYMETILAMAQQAKGTWGTEEGAIPEGEAEPLPPNLLLIYGLLPTVTTKYMQKRVSAGLPNQPEATIDLYDHGKGCYQCVLIDGNDMWSLDFRKNGRAQLDYSPDPEDERAEDWGSKPYRSNHASGDPRVSVSPRYDELVDTMLQAIQNLQRGS